MTVSVCPIAVIAAPVERVWGLLADPRQWDHWADGQVERVEPDGPACPGQTIVVSSVAFGRRWRVHFTIDAVDPDQHELEFTLRAPFGVVEQSHIGCRGLDETTCRVQYG